MSQLPLSRQCCPRRRAYSRSGRSVPRPTPLHRHVRGGGHAAVGANRDGGGRRVTGIQASTGCQAPAVSVPRLRQRTDTGCADCADSRVPVESGCRSSSRTNAVRTGRSVRPATWAADPQGPRTATEELAGATVASVRAEWCRRVRFCDSANSRSSERSPHSGGIRPQSLLRSSLRTRSPASSATTFGRRPLRWLSPRSSRTTRPPSHPNAVPCADGGRPKASRRAAANGRRRSHDRNPQALRGPLPRDWIAPKALSP